MEKYTMFMDWKNQYSENEYMIRGKTVFHKTSPWFQKLWGTTALKHKPD